MLDGRHAAAVALREVLRELYPAALRAYPDPAHPLALAVLDALPEPGRLTGRGGDSEQIAEEVAAELTRAGAGTDDQVIAAVTALHVAISESPRRGGVNKSLAPAAADTVRQAIAAVRSCDAACEALVGTLAARVSRPAATGRSVAAAAAPAEPPTRPCSRRTARRSTRADTGRPPQPPRAGRRQRPGTPRPLTTPPVAPEPMMPPPLAPRPVTPPPMAPAAARRGLPRPRRPMTAPGQPAGVRPAATARHDADRPRSRSGRRPAAVRRRSRHRPPPG